MYATNAEYNGVALKDVGFIIASFDGSSSGAMDVGANIVWNTSKAINSNRWNIHGKHYEDPLSTKFQIVKFDCPTHEVSEISPYEQAYLKRIFEDVNTYKPLRFLCDGYEDIYYMCTLQVNWYQIGGTVIGAELTVTCDSDHGYSPIQSFEANVATNGTFKIYDDSDKIGISFPDLIEIQAVSAGDIIIKNDLDSLYSGQTNTMSIKNCSAGETFIINGQTLQITSSNTSHKYLADDYNNEPIHLVNYDKYSTINNKELVEQTRLNTFTNLGVPIKLNLAYRTERLAVIPT